MGVVMLSDMPLEIPFPQLRTSTGMQQRCWAESNYFKVTKLLYLRTHLGWRHCTKEMSPQDTCVDGSGLPGCGDGVSYLLAAISES